MSKALNNGDGSIHIPRRSIKLHLDMCLGYWQMAVKQVSRRLGLLLEGLSCMCLGSWLGVLCVLARVMLTTFRCLLITFVCCLRVCPVSVREVRLVFGVVW